MLAQRSLKITPTHLERRAVIYIRQSSAKQVRLNTESPINQRALVERAQALGWPRERISVLEGDQGHSAASTVGRDDFTALTADVALGHIGIVFGWEVSRLARNNADWYQLLDLAAVMGTLIADVEGVYDPRSYNDRLLLGLKGTMSEAELHLMRQRLTAGRLSKVARGDYIQHLPTGLVRTPDGRVELDPDQQVRQVIALVLSTFAEVGSGMKTLHALKQRHMLLPRHQTSGLRKGELLWKEPTESMIIDILHNPAYAGAFVYGRRPTDPQTRKPGRRGTGVVRKPMDQWHTIIPGIYPAYIRWEQYLANQHRLADNARQSWDGETTGPGAARRGAAILQGLMVCGMCGHRMRVSYKPQIRYHCDGLARHYNGRICVSLDGASIEEVVVQALFAALQPAQLDALEAVLAQQRQEDERVRNYWRAQVQRTQYAAHLARRRYEAVDPDNRLVAAELERQWEAALVAVRQAEEERDQVLHRPSAPQLPPDMRQQLAHIAQSLPQMWPQLPYEHQKRLLRTLIARVIATRVAADRVELKVVWVSGHFSVFTVIPPIHRQVDVSNYDQLVARIKELSASGQTDTAIAQQLNAEGYHTARCCPITPMAVVRLRQRQGMYSTLQQYRQSDMIDGYWTVKGLAKELSVSHSWLYRRLETGSLGEPYVVRSSERRNYLIKNDPDLLARLRRERHTSQDIQS
jgi:DNA invertase Pin-like site-specific DNA recombinase